MLEHKLAGNYEDAAQGFIPLRGTAATLRKRPQKAAEDSKVKRILMVWLKKEECVKAGSFDEGFES